MTIPNHEIDDNDEWYNQNVNFPHYQRQKVRKETVIITRKSYNI